MTYWRVGDALLWARKIDLGVVDKGIAEYELLGFVITGGERRIDKAYKTV